MSGEKLKTAASWSIRIILGLLFIAAGAGKFMAAEVWQQKFAAWGLLDNLYLAIGLLEVVGAVLLFIPRFTTLAAGLLGTIMLGALMTHLFNGEMIEILRPLAYITPLAVLYFFLYAGGVSR